MPALVNGFGKGRPRETEGPFGPRLPPKEAAAATLALTAACATLWAWLAAPALYCAALCLEHAQDPGLGPGWLAAMAASYAGGYLCRGWEAAMRLGEALGASMPGAVLALAGFAALPPLASACYGQLTRYRNPILDKLPKKAGANEKGSATLVRDPDGLARAFAVLDANTMEAEKSGIVLGYSEHASLAGWAAYWCMRALPFCKNPKKPSGRYYLTDADTHLFLLGDTRAGKTRRILLTSLDVLFRGSSESAIVIDPKGELCGLSAAELASRGVDVVRIDFRNPAYSDCWNAMERAVGLWEEIARLGKAGPDKERLALYAQANREVSSLATMLFPARPDEGQSAYFNNGARGQIKSVIHWVASSPACPKEQKNLATVVRIISGYLSVAPLPQNDQKAFIPYEAMLADLPPTHPARETYIAGRGGRLQETAQFASTAAGLEVMSCFLDPAIASMSRKTDVPLDAVGRRRTAVFLIIPHDRAEYNALAALYIQQTYAALMELAKESTRLPCRVTIFGEELGNIPAIPDLAGKLGVCAGYGIRWLLCLQNIPKMTEKYGMDGATDVISACNTQILLKTQDEKVTAASWSEKLGEYTIATTSRSKSGRRISLFKENGGESVRLEARRQLTVNEILRWNPDFGALVSSGGSGEANNAYVIACPDISKTPSNAVLGLGDAEHNRKKVARTLYGGPPPARDYLKPWYPELGRARDYTDDELACAHDAYMRRLGAAWERASKAKGATAPQEVGKPERKHRALFDPATGEHLLCRAADTDPFALGQAHPGWEMRDFEKLADAKNWVANKKRSHEAGMAGGQGAHLGYKASLAGHVHTQKASWNDTPTPGTPKDAPAP